MSTITLTRDEAERGREAARDRHLEAREHTRSWALVIAESDVERIATGRTWTTSAELSGDELIVRRAAEHEAFADWQDARLLCGREAMVR
jgi:hypothetical protein